MRILILANHSGGLYDFRGALALALFQRATEAVDRAVLEVRDFYILGS